MKKIILIIILLLLWSCWKELNFNKEYLHLTNSDIDYYLKTFSEKEKQNIGIDWQISYISFYCNKKNKHYQIFSSCMEETHKAYKLFLKLE